MDIATIGLLVLGALALKGKPQPQRIGIQGPEALPTQFPGGLIVMPGPPAPTRVALPVKPDLGAALAATGKKAAVTLGATAIKKFAVPAAAKVITPLITKGAGAVTGAGAGGLGSLSAAMAPALGFGALLAGGAFIVTKIVGEITSRGKENEEYRRQRAMWYNQMKTWTVDEAKTAVITATGPPVSDVILTGPADEAFASVWGSHAEVAPLWAIYTKKRRAVRQAVSALRASGQRVRAAQIAEARRALETGIATTGAQAAELVRTGRITGRRIGRDEVEVIYKKPTVRVGRD
jgi:hypothetical protein